MRLNMTFAGFGLGIMALASAMPALADSGKTPLLVEMFTSKYCPNCPMAESKMRGVAADNTDLMVIFEHVDYWDDAPKRVDPYGLAEITQRQYDISGAMGRRPGEVFTPMPLIDGKIAVSPPLLFTWGSALEKGRALPEKPRLAVSKDKDGSVDVVIPASLYGANREVWVLGVDPQENTKVWRVAGITQGDMANGKVRIAAPSVPKGRALVVLLQEAGPGEVVAMGSLGVSN